tara:strand:+ start:14452 stop:15318 length:867 start_codon:yes stop_codon:yes gene_type:complete
MSPITNKKISNKYHNKKTKKICAPNSSKYSFSCFDKKGILKIAKAWNKKSNKKNRINLKEKNIKKIWDILNKNLKKKCQDELCWIKKIKVKNMKKYFRPQKPKNWKSNNYEWLSTVDIEKVLNQYEKKYSDFKFIGAVPIDFDEKYNFGNCIVDELCKLKLKNIRKKNIFKIGIVFNLDKHSQDGSHWVSMFIDLNNNNIYYFDSYGTKEPPQISKFIKRLQDEFKKEKKKINYQRNTIRHQFDNSECGIYSINFIINMLDGNNFNSFIKNIVKDEDMNKKRDYYFIS